MQMPTESPSTPPTINLAQHQIGTQPNQILKKVSIDLIWKERGTTRSGRCLDPMNRLIRFIGKVESEEMCGIIQSYVTYFPHTMHI